MTSNSLMEPMLTVGEAAALLHIHANTLRRWADRGYIRAYRITSRGDRRFRQEDITRFLDRLNAYHGNEKEAVLSMR